MLTLSPLRHATRRLIDIEAEGNCEGSVSYHNVISIVYEMMAGILSAERAGYSRQAILDAIAPAREIHGQSPFIRRLQTWPRGCPGDWETIEYLIKSENNSVPNSIAYHLENYVLNCPAAQHYRNKIRFQADLILKTLLSVPNPRILLIACAGCPDLRLVAPCLTECTANFVLNDIDSEALTFAKQQLTGTLANKCTLLPGNIFELIRNHDFPTGFDLVLVGGLCDYLPEKAVRRLIEYGYRKLLNSGGTLFLTNIAKGNPYRPWMEYCGEWFLVERTEEEISRICSDARVPTENLFFERDDTQLAILLRVEKNGP